MDKWTPKAVQALGFKDAFAAAAALSAAVERPNARRILRIAAAGACENALTLYVAGCNLGCVHCWAGNDREDPSLAQWCEYPLLLERIRRYRQHSRLDLGGSPLRISGGEPVLSERFFELLEVLLRLKGRIFVETNAVLLGTHPQWCRQLSALRARVYLKVSIKAGTAEQFERITGFGRDAWEATWAAIECLHSQGASFDTNALSMAPQLFSAVEREALRQRLARIGGSLLEQLEEEPLTAYPGTLRRMAL